LENGKMLDEKEVITLPSFRNSKKKLTAGRLPGSPPLIMQVVNSIPWAVK
jgi:hypothetical protein